MARPSQPLIRRDLAVAAALEIIDESGLDAFGLEKLAEHLNVKAPSLYYHFKGKQEILSEVTRLVLREVTVPGETPTDQWVDWFVEIGWSFRSAVLRHPNAAGLLITHFPRRFALRTYDRGAQLLTKADVPVVLHALIFEGLDKLVFGSAVITASDHPGGVFPGVDRRREPALYQAVVANPWNDEELFRQLLYAFLRGVEALIDAPDELPAPRRRRRVNQA